MFFLKFIIENSTKLEKNYIFFFTSPLPLPSVHNYGPAPQRRRGAALEYGYSNCTKAVTICYVVTRIHRT